MSPLERRILDCFPSGEYALTALLRVLEVAETEQVRTAAIENGPQPRLRINPAFAARHAATPERLFMLVMHELHHVLLGHTRLFPTATAVDNFVFDCVINSMLARMFPQPEYLGLFTELYSEREFPACLLRPRLRRGRLLRRPHPAALAGLPEQQRGAVAGVYGSLYSKAGAAYDELRDVLPAVLDEQEAAQVPLLGGHGEEPNEEGRAESRPGEAEENVRRDGGAAGGEDRDADAGPGPVGENRMRHDSVATRVVLETARRWKPGPAPVRGRSLNELLREGAAVLRPAQSNRAALRGLLRRVGANGATGSARNPAALPVPVTTAVPGADRRALVQRALGGQPLLYRSQSAMPGTERGARVHVYADVSGSMGGAVGAAYAAVADCRRWVHPEVHLFSTRIHDASLAEIRAGAVRTTGGTDIACVAEHMAARGVRRACIITDGRVGVLRGTHRETLARARLGVALMGAGAFPEPLAEVADWTVTLTESDRGNAPPPAIAAAIAALQAQEAS